MIKKMLYMLAAGVSLISCSKTVVQPLTYSVTDQQKNPIQNIYITTNSSVTVPIEANFLGGNIYDSVKLVFTGLPANVTVSPDTFSAKPSYTEDFVFTGNNAATGTYQATLTAYTESDLPNPMKFNIIVVPTNCPTLFGGTLNGTSACSTTYSYTSAATAGTSTLSINNFGGFGTNTNATVSFNCNSDSVYVYSQSIGNGVTVQGAGTFTPTSITINYTASNIPTGGNETCTVTYTK